MNPLTIVHIAGGSTALLSGAAALSLRKGGRMHAKAGTLFFGAMLVMAGTGATIAAFKPERITSVIGVFTLYLVATSWMAARHRDGEAGRFEKLALLVALACGATLLAFGVVAANSPNGRLDSLPAAPAFGFAAVAALAAALDLNFILRGRISRTQRIARHLWRMCTALLIASFSFFLGQQKVMPLSWHGSGWLFVPELAVVAAMIFWIFRVRFSRAFGRAAPKPAAALMAP